LIGLAINERERWEADEVVVALHAGLVGRAVTTWEPAVRLRLTPPLQPRGSSSTADRWPSWSLAWTTGISRRRARLVPPRDSVRNMSQQNVAVARRWVELFNARDDVDEFLSLHDPEVVLQTPGGPRLRGHDQVRDWFEAGYENVQPRILPERFVAGGDTVVGLGRIELRWIESGEVAHEGESAGAYWFRDGKIIMWQPFESHAAALNETGLGE
jgi:ketosteroid isomerase-like protein